MNEKADYSRKNAFEKKIILQAFGIKCNSTRLRRLDNIQPKCFIDIFKLTNVHKLVTKKLVVIFFKVCEQSPYLLKLQNIIMIFVLKILTRMMHSHKVSLS